MFYGRNRNDGSHAVTPGSNADNRMQMQQQGGQAAFGGGNPAFGPMRRNQGMFSHAFQGQGPNQNQYGPPGQVYQGGGGGMQQQGPAMLQRQMQQQRMQQQQQNPQLTPEQQQQMNADRARYGMPAWQPGLTDQGGYLG